MNWAIKIISKILMTEIFPISWGGYDKGFYGNADLARSLNKPRITINWEFYSNFHLK